MVTNTFNFEFISIYFAIYLCLRFLGKIFVHMFLKIGIFILFIMVIFVDFHVCLTARIFIVTCSHIIKKSCDLMPTWFFWVNLRFLAILFIKDFFVHALAQSGSLFALKAGPLFVGIHTLQAIR